MKEKKKIKKKKEKLLLRFASIDRALSV